MCYLNSILQTLDNNDKIRLNDPYPFICAPPPQKKKKKKEKRTCLNWRNILYFCYLATLQNVLIW